MSVMIITRMLLSPAKLLGGRAPENLQLARILPQSSRKETSMQGWHELWAHRLTGEVLAIHLVNGFVAGICGPLSISSSKEVDLTTLTYDATVPAIYRVSTQ